MVKLRRLKILKYRNIKPGTELFFDDGINLVLGQNASGKTTLLALISAVCRSAFDTIADEEFELEYELATAADHIVAEVSHRARYDVQTQAISTPTLWIDRYALSVRDGRTPANIEIRSDDSASATGRVPLIMDWSFIAATLGDHPGSLAELRTRLFSCASAFRFDESLDSFAAMTGRTPALRGAAVPPATYVSWHARSDPRGGVSVSGGAYVPGELSRALQLSFRGRGDALSLRGSEGPLAEQMALVLDVPRVDISPQVGEMKKTGGNGYFRVEGFTFTVIRRDGTAIHHDRLSYGQKRLLAFFYYLACNPSVVVADELVNGLHHRWIEASMKAISDRQAFLTSQNPLLFDYVTFDSVEQVQSRFITCKLEQQPDGREQMVWQNMSRDDATRFFDAYQTGIEHVGDILITRGMW